jgi:hypothetical protein
MAEAKLLEIEEKIKSLEVTRVMLTSLVDACGGVNTPLSDCPILEQIETGGCHCDE